MKSCFGKIRLLPSSSLRYTNIACVFCEENFACATVSGRFLPVDTVSFAARLLLSQSLNRRQVLSYLRDHYRVKMGTAKDSIRGALRRIQEFFDFRQPRRRPAVISPRLDLDEGKKDLARLAITLLTRHSVCLPFVGDGTLLREILPFFQYVVAFDDHPIGMREGIACAKASSKVTFYPCSFSSVHEKIFSAIFVDTRRVLSIEYLDSLNAEASYERGSKVVKSLSELLLIPPPPKRLASFESIFKQYTRMMSSTIILWVPKSCYRETLLDDIQSVLPPTHYLREGILTSSRSAAFIIITRVRRKSNVGKEVILRCR